MQPQPAPVVMAPAAPAPVMVAQPAPVMVTQPVPVTVAMAPAHVQINSAGPAHLRARDASWGHGTCGCFGNIWPTCICGWCCPCIAYGKIMSWITTGTSCMLWTLIFLVVYSAYDICYSYGASQYTNGGYGYYAYSVGGLFGMILICLVTHLRTKFRTAYALPGTVIEDFCCSCWCMGCELCRMLRFAYTDPNTGLIDQQKAGHAGETGTDPELGMANVGLVGAGAVAVGQPVAAPVMVAKPQYAM